MNKVKLSIALKMIRLKRWVIKKLGGYTRGELLLAKQQGVILARHREAMSLVKPPQLEVTHYDISKIKAKTMVSDVMAIDIGPKDLEKMVRYQLTTNLAKQLESQLELWQTSDPRYPGSIIFETELRVASKRGDEK